MEFYTKRLSDTQEVSEKKEISGLEVHIKSGKKIKVCISQVLKTLQTSKDKVVISGSGPTVTKAITTAEIVKRKVKGLHQQNNLYYTKTEDLWEPKQEGLDQLKVTRNVPSISIMLSYKPLDQQTPGYQAPGIHQPLVQFRDEDIALADDKDEGKTGLRQLSGHYQQKDNRKPGTKRNRKQSHGKQQHIKKEKTASEGDNATEKETEEKSSTDKRNPKKHRKPKQSKTHEKDKT